MLHLLRGARNLSISPIDTPGIPRARAQVSDLPRPALVSNSVPSLSFPV